MASAVSGLGDHRDAVRKVCGGATSLLLVLTTLILAVPVIGEVTGSWRFVPILSGSMTPTFSTGSLVVATPVPLERLRVGEVVLYRIPVGDHHLIAHRIVRLDRHGGRPVVETKGDANQAKDPWRARLNGSTAWVVRGGVPFVGYASVFARSLGPLLLLLSVVVVGLAWALRLIWRDPPDRLNHGGDQRAPLHV